VVCRDFSGVFDVAARVFKRLCERRGVLASISDLPRILAVLESIRRVLFGKLKIQGQTLANLENNKGSDASAAQATCSAISTAKQIIALHGIIRAVRADIRSSRNGSTKMPKVPATPSVATATHHINMEWMREITGDGSLWVPRNTIVRDIFNKVLHSHDLQLPVLSPASPNEGDDPGYRPQQRPVQMQHAAKVPPHNMHGAGAKATACKAAMLMPTDSKAASRAQQVHATPLQRTPLQPTNGRRVFRLNMEN
jgi:hypothetical protein